MINKVRIRNYQSLKDTQVELGVLTVIVGLSDLGKSAFFRAIRSAVEAASGSDFITYGEKAAIVDLWIDGRQFTWEKGAQKNQYKLDAEVWEKVGRSVPPDVAEFLGMGEVEFDTSLKLNLNFADQEDPPFLIPFPGGLTSSGVAKILGDLTNLNVLYRAQGAAEQKRRQADGLVKVRNSDLLAIDASLLVYADLDERILELEEVEDLWTEVQTLHRDLQVLNTYRAEKEDLRTRHTVLKLDMESQGPDLSEYLQALEENAVGLNELRNFKRELEEFNLNITLLESALQDAVVEESEAEEELRTLMESLEICPLCDRVMDHEHAGVK